MIARLKIDGEMPKRFANSSILFVGVVGAISTAPLYADEQNREPLVTRSKIEAVAAACDAKVTISDAPNYDEETGDVQEKGMLIVGVQRNNSPEAIACMSDYVPTVVTMLVGRESGVPPLNQAILDDVLKQCDWRQEDGVVSLINGDELKFQPKATADYDRVDCVLKGVRRYAPKMGFIGNEQYRIDKEKE
jgi:hypothetical protein